MNGPWVPALGSSSVPCSSHQLLQNRTLMDDSRPELREQHVLSCPIIPPHPSTQEAEGSNYVYCNLIIFKCAWAWNDGNVPPGPKLQLHRLLTRWVNVFTVLWVLGSCLDYEKALLCYRRPTERWNWVHHFCTSGYLQTETAISHFLADRTILNYHGQDCFTW